MALLAIPVIAAACGIGYSLFTLWCVASFDATSDKSRTLTFTPPVSILKPLCGSDPHAYESLRSHCVQDYPEFEIIFGVRDPDDAAVGLVQRLREEFPALRLHLVLCPHTL